MKIELANDIQQYISLAQQLQQEANKYNIFHVFEDGGYKELIMMKMFDLNRLEGRHGDDGVDGKGRRVELKTVNLVNTRGERRKSLNISTCHHLNYEVLHRYRNGDFWLVGVFHVNEPAKIYEISTSSLEVYFERWEQRLDELKKKGIQNPHLNNPKIGCRYVEENGVLHYQNDTYYEFFQNKKENERWKNKIS